MTKLYNHPIEVQTVNGLPAAFRWRRRWHQVTSCEIKKAECSRLQHFGATFLLRYRCETRQGVVCDLVREGDRWMLERVWD